MTKQDFELIADAVRVAYSKARLLRHVEERVMAENACEDVAFALAGALQKDNENFNLAIFLKACRPSQE